MTQRYEDWCDVVGGAVRLRVPGPVIGHMAREFESMLRAALKTPFEVATQLPRDVQDNLDAAKAALEGFGYDDAKVRNAAATLRPETHKVEIDTICQRIGLPIDAEVNQAWKDLFGQAGRAHWRSYWKSSSVESHAETIDRFEFVMREVLAALERRYDAFFQQIDRLIASADPRQAAKTFAEDIPLSPILQQRFYTGAPISAAWINALRARTLFSDRVPVDLLEADQSPPTYVPWLQGMYLIRAAGSVDDAARREAGGIVAELVSTEDFAILESCARAVTSLPAEEAAPFADTFVTWLKARAAWPVNSQAAEFVKKMSAANMTVPAFLVARTLFGFEKDEAGRMTARFDSSMYAYHIRLLAPQLSRLHARLAFDLFIELFISSLEFRSLLDPDRGRDYSANIFDSLAASGPTGYEDSDALFQVANEAAIEACVSPAETRDVITCLRQLGIRLTDRIALDLASQNVTQIPDVADDMLLDQRLMDGYWCRAQYANLARARLPTAEPVVVDAVLKLANSIPDRFEDNWLANRRAMGWPEPTEADIADYRAATVLDVLFQFKDVLPEDVRSILDKSAKRYRVEPHLGTPTSISDTAGSEGKFLPFPPGSTGALMEEAQARPEEFFKQDRLADIPVGNLWIVFDGLKAAQNRGVPIVWEPIFSWIDKALPRENHWGSVDGAPELRVALVAALQLIVANLELRDPRKTPLPFMRLATLVMRFWAFPLDSPTSELPWPEVDPAGASFRTVSGLSLILAFRLAFIEDDTASADPGFTSSQFAPLVFERINKLIADIHPTADLCRGQIGMWFSNLLDRAPNWTVQQIPALFGDATPVDIRPAWYGYVQRAGSTAVATHTLEPYYRAAIERVGDNEPANWGDLRPSYQLGFRLVREFMLGFIDIDESGLFSSFLRRASDELRARLVWVVWHWVGAPEAEPDIIERGICFAEARLAVAEATNRVDDLTKEFSGFSTWLEAPKLDIAWLIEIVGRIADLGLVGAGIFSTFRWLEKICNSYPDAALETASRVILHDADGQAIYGSTGPIRAILTAALTQGTLESRRRAVELASALEVRGVTGMYDHVTALLQRPSGKDEPA
jgi:hypothetical protein